MSLERLAGLLDRAPTEALRACHDALPPGPADYRALAALLADLWCEHPPGTVGLGGGQGAGKSTLTALIVAACSQRGLRAAALSLDDFYLPRAARQALAREVHPLFETRGPPGTHDVSGCCEAIRALRRGNAEVPLFDKGRDDRCGTRRVAGPADVIVLEGWCIGAPPLAAATLHEPINALEAEKDPDAHWRTHSAQALSGPYAALFMELDALVFLAVPDLDAVRRWRLQQEQERPQARRMGAAEVEHFVAHYERITRAMLTALPQRADLVVALDAGHDVRDLYRGHQPPQRAPTG